MSTTGGATFRITAKSLADATDIFTVVAALRIGFDYYAPSRRFTFDEDDRNGVMLQIDLAIAPSRYHLHLK